MEIESVKELDVEYNVDTNGIPYVSILSTNKEAERFQMEMLRLPLEQYEQLHAAIRLNHFASPNLKREWEAAQREDMKAEAPSAPTRPPRIWALVAEHDPGEYETRMLAAQRAGMPVSDEQMKEAIAADKRKR